MPSETLIARAQQSFVLATIGFLVSGIPAWSDPIQLRIATYAIGCNNDLSLNGPTLEDNILSGSASNSCTVSMLSTVPFNVDVHASAEPFNASTLLGSVQASVSTAGPGVSGIADAITEQELTLSPPPSSTDPSATIQAGDSYGIGIMDEGFTTPASAYIYLILSPVFGSPVSATQEETTNGSFSGTLLTPELTVFGCPCTLTLQVDASATAANGSDAMADDPGPFLVVPPGWTYAFVASSTPEPSTVPEPASVFLLGVALLVIFGVMRRRSFLERKATKS